MRKVLFGVMLLLMLPFMGHAGEVDILINKLVEKGILTPLEAQIIQDETKAEVARQNAQGKNEAIPSWVQKVKFKGDMRLRYQTQEDENNVNRDRARARFRLGVESKINDEFKVGAGLATGGDDPRSSNQTLEDSFETKEIQLDYAYLEYQPIDWAKFIGGKFKRKKYLWNPTDLLWDGDINPEGLSTHLSHGLTDSVDGFLNAGWWSLEENSSTSEASMYYAQAGVKGSVDAFDYKVAGTYYDFDEEQGNNFKWCKATNTGLTGSNSSTGACTGSLTYEYDSYGLSGEFGMKLEDLPIERIAIFGDYIENPDPNDHNTGYALGFKFGHKKVKKPGNWQVKYIYADLERDAWLDVFPDSDRFGGRTDVKSHEVVFKYALQKNVFLGLDYYDSERISNSGDTDKVFQADIMVKF